jgi:hypothetical protein
MGCGVGDPPNAKKVKKKKKKFILRKSQFLKRRRVSSTVPVLVNMVSVLKHKVIAIKYKFQKMCKVP